MSTHEPPFDLDDLQRNYEQNRQPKTSEIASRYVFDLDDAIREWVNSKPSIFDKQ